MFQEIRGFGNQGLEIRILGDQGWDNLPNIRP